ncbi:MAG: 3-oxoacyl-ACP reductase [Planctomycetaceae bacterium]|nr:3-oxoacyl-ACP reductase [Planctomycetaceae bacterium]
MNSTKKSAIVTGGGSGVGRAVALELLQRDYQVVLAGRRLEKLQETVQEAGSSGVNATPIVTDVSDPQSVESLFAGTQEKFGRLDVLFNNAGSNIAISPLEDVSVEDWDSLLRVNLSGVFWCIQQAFRIMKAQIPGGGRIINNGSISAHVPRPHAAAYNATKHGVTGLTKSASLEGRKYNIACGQIDIGNAKTNMTADLEVGRIQADGSSAVEPSIDVEHVARAVAYMADLPLDANVQFMTIMATEMPYVGRG